MKTLNFIGLTALAAVTLWGQPPTTGTQYWSTTPIDCSLVNANNFTLTLASGGTGYAEFGITPTYDFKKTYGWAFTLSAPTWISVGPSDYWNRNVFIAGGPGDRTRILWNNTDGRGGVSFADSGGSLETSRYAAEDGWSFVDLAVAGDNHTRLLRSHEDGRIAVWRINERGTPESLGTIYAAPAGLRAARLSAGPDGLTRVLWRSSDGLAVVWLMSGDGEYQSSLPLN